MKTKVWKLPCIDKKLTQPLSELLNIPPIVTEILYSRGMTSPAEITAFFGGDKLGDPYSIADMDLAVKRIQEAVEQNQNIVIYGDYDCDGIVGTVLLYLYLESIGAAVSYYIPSRKEEGYGLNKKAVQLIKQNEADLLITVDNGISAVEEVKFAAEIGLDVIITDHHRPTEELPELIAGAVAVIDPHRTDDSSGYHYLCGTGVAFKLICALEGSDTGEELLDCYGELVAIATVGDIVPLIGENRTIVKRGLQTLGNSENLGITAILDVCGLSGKTLTSESVAFGIVPRINAAGRFDEVDHVIELLVTDDSSVATEQACQINQLNLLRKSEEQTILSDIKEILQHSPEILHQRIIVLKGEDWNHGVIGIVASKITEQFGKPTMLFAADGEQLRGSCRSIEGFSIITAIQGCSDLLTRFGGHHMAAGLSLHKEQFESFKKEFLGYVDKNYGALPPLTLCFDKQITPDELTVANIEAVSLMQPFGSANQPPLFYIDAATIDGIYPIGGGKHLRLRLSTKQGSFYAVYFGVTEQTFQFELTDVVDIAAAIDINEYNGEKNVSVKIRDMRLSGKDYEKIFTAFERYSQFQRSERISITAELVPTRDEIGKLYKLIRSKKTVSADVVRLHKMLQDDTIDYCKLLFCMDILKEMDLIISVQPDHTKYTILQNPAKVDLSQSKILQKINQLSILS